MSKDLELMEGVQKRATKLVHSKKNYSYKERFKFFQLNHIREGGLEGIYSR
jgi:hypothetical protein